MYGGTDYSAIRFADADETLLFSDGLSTLSDAGHLSASHLVYTISSSPKANYDLLRSIAEQSGGSFINLAGCTAEEGLNGLTKQALLFLGIRKNKNVTEHYSATPVVVQNGFSMAGKLDAAPAVITLRFGYGKEVAFEKEVALNYDEYEIEDWDLSKLFAQKKIQELEKNYERNKDEILLLGKQYSIVTQNTSLLVLEDIMDYVRHEIEPPFELRAEYKRLLKERRDEVTRQQQNILERAIGYSNLLWEWYHTSYPVKRKPVTKYTVAEAMDMEFATVDTTAVIADGIASFDAAPPPPPSARQEANKVQEVILEVLSDSKIEEVAFNHNRFISGYEDEDGNDPKIKLEQKASKSSYLKILSQSPRYLQYQTYLELRNQNLSNPTFYYEVATFFLKQDKALGLQILTNLGELDYQNHEILKLLGFKLKELGEPNLQQYVFRKILTWRPQEPQSCRDYALVLAENGKYQAALDTLYLALTKDYNIDVMSNYKGIEETIVMEINHLISKYRSRLNSSAINHKLVHRMPLDIRVVLNWNMNDTDIDLWVTDPAGEKCFYSHKETRIGGRMSDDFTQGYGPEQFLLRKADKGKYKIQVHYYGERGVKVAGKTTLLVEVFTNYGRPTEQRKMITLQLEGEEREGVYVGEFVF